jgi:hypothetical protein
MLIFLFGISLCEAQTKADRAPKPARRGLFGLFSGKRKSGKVKAKSVQQIEKDQAKKKKKQDEEYAKSIKESKKRTIKIQTAEVQDRMKQDQKDIADREKAKKKKTSATTRKAGRKYKK